MLNPVNEKSMQRFTHHEPTTFQIFGKHILHSLLIIANFKLFLSSVSTMLQLKLLKMRIEQSLCKHNSNQ